VALRRFLTFLKDFFLFSNKLKIFPLILVPLQDRLSHSFNRVRCHQRFEKIILPKSLKILDSFPGELQSSTSVSAVPDVGKSSRISNLQIPYFDPITWLSILEKDRFQ
jgi:hypothetical protein